MPVRARAVEALARHLEGGLSFNNVLMTVKLGRLGERREIDRDTYDAVYDQAYVKMVDAIDWNRVLLEALTRHLALQRVGDHGSEFGDYGDEICPECVCEALLATDTMPSWDRQPKAPR